MANTKRVKMLWPVSGICDGVPWPEKGDVADLPAGMAQSAIDAELAEETDEDVTPSKWSDIGYNYETADAPEAETHQPARKRAAKK